MKLDGNKKSRKIRPIAFEFSNFDRHVKINLQLSKSNSRFYRRYLLCGQCTPERRSRTIAEAFVYLTLFNVVGAIHNKSINSLYSQFSDAIFTLVFHWVHRISLALYSFFFVRLTIDSIYFYQFGASNTMQLTEWWMTRMQ